MRDGDEVKRMENVRALDNEQQPSKKTALCFCGLTSFKCCKKRTIQKVS